MTIYVGPPNGPTLLLLPGMLDLWGDYHLALPFLASRFQVVVGDHRGHGESDHDPDGDYRVVDYAGDWIALIEQCFDAPVYLSGHSLGGMIALYIAAKRPDLVCGLVLEDAPLFVTEGPAWRRHWAYPFFLFVAEMLKRWRSSGEEVGHLVDTIAGMRMFRPRNDVSWADRTIACGKTLAQMRAAGLNMDAHEDGWMSYLAGHPTTMSACLPAFVISTIAQSWSTVDPRVPRHAVDNRSNEGFDHGAALKALACRTLTLEADRDVCGLLSPTDIQRMVECLYNVPHRHVTVHGAGHAIHSDAPERFADELVSFFLNDEEAV